MSESYRSSCGEKGKLERGKEMEGGRERERVKG